MNIMFFSIPAYGHTNPTIEVVRALTQRGHRVRYYSFEPFRARIEGAGAEFIPCDDALPPAPGDLDTRMGRDFSLLMEMVIGVTAQLHPRMEEEMRTFRPDCIVSDSICIWGKLFAKRFGVPLVVSTTTFAFNRYTAKLMKQSLRDVLMMVTGMPRVMKQLGTLEALGYEAKGVIELLQNDNETDTIVYTSRKFQPRAETFSNRYAFVGPSVVPTQKDESKKEHPLVYVSLGTVLNRNQGFYRACIAALRQVNCDAVLSVGPDTDIGALGQLPEHIKVYPRVNQMEVLARADAFITHCGMNSVMESLYMGVPMALFPQHPEERAVANRVAELGAGVPLRSARERDIRDAVMKLLGEPSYINNAGALAKDMRSCGGAQEAAVFIERIAGTHRKQKE